MNQIVYVVEDDEAVRDSLLLLLRAEGYSTKGYSSAQSFLEEEVADLNGCLVLDIRMPGMTGMELHKKLLELGCALPVIFVTGHGDVAMAVEAMKLGAVDFVQKPYREEDLLEKVKGALAMDAEQKEALRHKEKLRQKIESLTPRELEIMEMMIEGNANKVIAIELNISQRTVEIHRSRVMQKMGTHSLAQLVQMVLAARS
ncbi:MULTISPECIES: response regulator transcription factor [unclassified Hahella]|uniref:response regulator transcription factor n=1 Tax=unclassified Hahella TaxID=2624107 RepID=UPI001F4E2FB9|nr:MULTISPECIES: response regulator [unclassified Hahella]MDG9668303.1 response regulator [Hahella sp. CR1]WLQ14678.1 response regulator [Hahella sp. HNIBRBA332]